VLIVIIFDLLNFSLFDSSMSISVRRKQGCFFFHCYRTNFFVLLVSIRSNGMDKKLVIAAVDVIASNADILCEILVRLPASSLVRFSVVCKL